jgi:hypothetical protein
MASQGIAALEKATTGNVQYIYFFLYSEGVISTRHCEESLRESTVFIVQIGKNTLIYLCTLMTPVEAEFYI